MNIRETIRILLADDYAPLREFLREHLQKTPGIEVVGEAEDGSIAVELTQRLLPDIVIMDVNMPIMGGIEATRRITTETPEVKVIAFTSSAYESITRQMLEAGASAFLVKGGDLAKIASVIKAVTEDNNHG